MEIISCRPYLLPVSLKVRFMCKSDLVSHLPHATIVLLKLFKIKYLEF